MYGTIIVGKIFANFSGELKIEMHFNHLKHKLRRPKSGFFPQVLFLVPREFN